VNKSTATSIGTMLSTAVTALKDAKELSQDSKDGVLKQKIEDAYDILINLTARLLEYDEEINSPGSFSSTGW
jgi:hypothetical protein